MHLAATHCPNKRTLDPQSAARQIHLCHRQPDYGLQHAILYGDDSLFLVPDTNGYSFT